MARTIKYPTELIVKTLTEMKGMVYLSAEKIGCHPETIYHRAKSCQAIRDAIASERGKLIDFAELKLYNAVMNGEQWAVQMCLKTIGKARGYVEQKDVNIDGSVKIRVVEEIVTVEEEADARRTIGRADGADQTFPAAETVC